MRMLALGAALFLGQSILAEPPLREAGYARLGPIVPTFDRGYVFQPLESPRAAVMVQRPDGAVLFTTRVEVPGTTGVSVWNGAADSDGVLAVGAAYRTEGDRHGGGIAYFDHTGKQARFVDTSPYVPTHLSFGADHSLWTLGYVWGWNRKAAGDYRIVRRYSAEGKETGAFLPRSVFPPGLEPGMGPLGSWSLRVVHDRVGALLVYGDISKNKEWVELDLNGELLGRWKLGKYTGLAFTDSAHLYRYLWKGHEAGLEMFDRDAGKFREIEFTPPANAALLGAEGNDLVYQAADRLIWVRAPQ